MCRLTVLRHLLPGVGLLFLPGCLAINALFGGIGLIASGPIQYVGTAYTIGEYAYEYAANDRNPAEVLGERITLLTSPEQWPGEMAAHMRKPPPEQVHVAEARPPRPASRTIPAPETRQIRIADASEIPFTRRSVIRKHTPIRPMPEAKPLRRFPNMPDTRRMASLPAPAKVSPSASMSSRKPRPSMTKPPRPSSPRTIRNAPANAPDPLLARLNRLQQSFHQAEALAEQQGGPGIRIQVGPKNTPGLNGAWSIRHSLMQHPPGPPRAQLRTTMSGT